MASSVAGVKSVDIVPGATRPAADASAGEKVPAVCTLASGGVISVVSPAVLSAGGGAALVWSRVIAATTCVGCAGGRLR